MNRTTASASTAAGAPLDSASRQRGSTVEEMGECSFPASDPPAVWTWEVSDPSEQSPPRYAKERAGTR
jgi:hypothetical protein